MTNAATHDQFQRKNDHFLLGFIVKSQEKAWIDHDLMKVWFKDIWLKHILAECKKQEFENSLLSFDAFTVHLTNGVKINYWKIILIS